MSFHKSASVSIVILYRRYSRKGWHLQQGDKESRWVGGDKDGTWLYNPIIEGQTKDNYPLVIRYGKGNPQLIHGFPLEKVFLELNCHAWAMLEPTSTRIPWIHREVWQLCADHQQLFDGLLGYASHRVPWVPKIPGSRCGEGDCVRKHHCPQLIL